MRVLRRATVLALLGLTLGTPWAAASARLERAPGESMRAARVALGTLNLWSLFASFWNKEGCTMGPLGCPQASSTDEGCGIDPLGCPQAPSTDEGCTIDPLGGCVPNR
jgi:hypothetical protein